MNIPEAFSASSAFLESIENITSSLINDSFAIETDFILLNKTTFTDTFNGDFNSSVEIDIPEADGGNESITVITFSSMDNVLPARDELNSSSNVINGRVVLVQSKASISNISFTFDVINDALGNPQCVFWNFSLFNGLGGWDNANGDNGSACSTAAFFIHFFYLALFFWMLASALLLLYRMVSVFEGGLSKRGMLAIGFTIGYGVPLIIAVITIAVTAPKKQYIQETGVCWLRWTDSKALLAFVIPALTIVVINLFILIVVLYKMLRRRAVRDAAQTDEKNALLVVARSLAVLTPIFGLTWALGIGTMIDPHNRPAHVSFAFFNSLQGFFILVFGTLLDKKSTSGGTSSSSGLGFFRNFRRGRGIAAIQKERFISKHQSIGFMVLCARLAAYLG
ncbi:hypothetical protein INR49_004450 [Caranx melampygus]|nr:hypothetical protein INR49_004450 [Caranx melampygus]